jgi:gluconate 2-dehydrogenase alpha chain
MARQGAPVYGIFEGRRLNRFTGSSGQGQTIDDFNADNFDHAGLQFIRGGRVTAANNFPPILSSAIVPPSIPRWGRAYKGHLARHFNSLASLDVETETLPYETNMLDLDPDVRDAAGVPVIRITFDVGDNEPRVLSFLQDRAEPLLAKMGAGRIWRAPLSVDAVSTHDVGGTRMGTDPARSVVDGYGRVHDAPNVFVLGGSTFPTHGSMSPTLTMQALALRTGLHVAGAGRDALRPATQANADDGRVSPGMRVP